MAYVLTCVLDREKWLDRVMWLTCLREYIHDTTDRGDHYIHTYITRTLTGGCRNVDKTPIAKAIRRMLIRLL